MFRQSHIFLLLVAAAAVLSIASADHAEVPAAVPARDFAIKVKKTIHEVNINDLIDNNLDAIRDALMEMDPMDLEDMKFPVTPHIYMNLHTGWLQNLSLLNRAGRCMLTYTKKVLTADITLGWDEIAFDYRYLLKVLLVTRKGDLHGQLSKLKVNVVVDIDFESYQVTLKRVDFSDTGKVTISVEGHISDKILNLVLKAVTTVSKKLILKTIQSKATDMIQVKIDEINQMVGKNHNMFTFVDLIKPEQVPAYVYRN